MSLMIDIAIGIYLVDGVLFASLAYVYGRTAISTRASYPIGLFIFSLLLIFQSLGTAFAYGTFPGYFGDEVQPMMAVMAVFELAGAAALVRVTL